MEAALFGAEKLIVGGRILADKAEVKFGEDANNLIYTATDEGVKKWSSGASVRYSHRAMMRDLKPSTQYCEQCSLLYCSERTR